MLRYLYQTLASRRVPRLAPEQVAEIQTRRLRALVRHAVDRSPFFRELYRGIDPDRCRIEDLPTTSKALLMADFDRTVTDPEVTAASLEAFMADPEASDGLYLGRYVAAHTSGSQGQPMLLVQPRSQLELTMRLQMSRGYAGQVSAPQAIRRLFEPVRLAVVTLKRGFYPSATLFQHLPPAARRFLDVLWVSQTEPDVVERLNAFQPNVLTGYAGVLELLALEAEAGRLRLGPALEQVVSNSEALTDKARSRISATFGRRVLDNYATGECPFLSNGCTTDPGAHVNSDWVVFEVVDDRNRPVPAGQPGQKVLMTNLSNAVQPFLRYEIGDVVTMADTPCGCGSRLPRIARIDGRTADVFLVGAGEPRRRMVNLFFSHTFEYVSEIREWQARQQSDTRVLVRLEPIPGRSLDLERVQEIMDRELRRYGYPDVRVDFEVVPRIEADPESGKQRRMVGLPPGSPRPAEPVALAASG